MASKLHIKSGSTGKQIADQRDFNEFTRSEAIKNCVNAIIKYSIWAIVLFVAIIYIAVSIHRMAEGQWDLITQDMYTALKVILAFMIGFIQQRSTS